MGGHRSVQQQDADSVVPVPAGLPPQEAVIARLMGVSLTTLMTTKARPGDIVLVTGMGPVGYLCAHLFANSGYDVRIVEPNAARRTMAEKSGLKAVDLSLPADIQSIQGKVALVAECSGHEKAVLDGARMLRKAGELVLIGVPWKRRTDITAHEILSLVFFNYIVLRSGWEWELPHHASDFRPHSIFGGYQLALRWLAERRIPLEGLISLRDPADAQSVYQELHSGKMQGLFQVFDWEHQGRN